MRVEQVQRNTTAAKLAKSKPFLCEIWQRSLYGEKLREIAENKTLSGDSRFKVVQNIKISPGV